MDKLNLCWMAYMNFWHWRNDLMQEKSSLNSWRLLLRSRKVVLVFVLWTRGYLPTPACSGKVTLMVYVAASNTPDVFFEPLICMPYWADLCHPPFKVVFSPCCLHPSNICGMFCVLGCQGVSPTKCSSPFLCPERLPSCLCCFRWRKMELGKQDVDVLIRCIIFHTELESRFANSLLYITTVRELSGEKRSVFTLYSFRAIFIREGK